MLALAVGYFVFAWVGARLSDPVTQASHIWPANGLGLGALLVCERRRWPVILSVVFLVNLLVGSVEALPLPLNFGYATVNSLLCLVAAWVALRFMQARVTLTRVRSVVGFTLVAVLGASAVLSMLGAAVAKVTLGFPFWEEWRVFWIAECLGLLVVTPVVIAWSEPDEGRWKLALQRRALETCVLFGGLFATVTVVFANSVHDNALLPSLSYLVVPFMVWAAFRTGARGTSSANLVISFIAVWFTDQGKGPFVGALGSGANTVLQLQAFLAVVTISSLLICAALVERSRLEARLRQSHKMQALGTLAGGVAHDFNNILGAIIGYGEMALTGTQENSRQSRHLRTILEAGVRGKELVAQILAFSRGGAYTPRPIHLTELVEEAKPLISAATPAGISVIFDLARSDLIVLGDSTQLHRVVVNLCTNALQAMEAGGTLRISCGEVKTAVPFDVLTGPLPAGNYATFEVRDTGRGMDAETMARMFEPFFTTRAPGKGVGLGLALVHGAVMECGGGIHVTSTPGQGSEFLVYLPLAAVARTQVDGTAPRPRTGKGETILVVDDDETMLRLAEEMLAESGYEPVGYSQSPAALAAFNADPQRFDLIVTDEIMPDLSGTELAAKCREVLPRIPILLTTGFGGTQFSEKAARAGFSEILGKPYRQQELAAAVGRILEKP
jgi:signal transduction histidine kinase/CheY-like chemotaxis protein